MRSRAFVVAALIAPLLGGLCAPARAVEPAVLAAFERQLDPLERAILSSVLALPGNDAAFTADMVEARKDSAGLNAALNKWRQKMAQFATSDRNAPNPNLEAAYTTYPEMLTPPIRAYLSRRLRDLRDRGAAGDREAQTAYDTLRDYLAAVQASLDDGHHLSWYTKRVVAGIMDKYRSELVEYLGTAHAREGLREGPAASAELDRRRTAAAGAVAAGEEEARRRAAAAEAERQRLAREQAAEQERLARERAAAGQPPATGGQNGPAEQPVVESPRPDMPAVAPAETPAQRTAREQAEAAERLTREGRPGQVFDNGGLVVGEPGGGAVVVPAPGEAGPRAGGGLTGSPASRVGGPEAGPGVPNLTGDDELLNSIRGRRGNATGHHWIEKVPAPAGMLLGGLLGLLLGGPIGLLIGAVAGGAAGYFGGKLFFK